MSARAHNRPTRVMASAPIKQRRDQTLFYTVGATPSTQKIQEQKSSSKYMKDLVVYGAAAAVILYVIYGKK